MAELGPGEHTAGDVAAVMGRRTEQLGPIRARLIDKGLIYTTGQAAATSPSPSSTATRAATTNSHHQAHAAETGPTPLERRKERT